MRNKLFEQALSEVPVETQERVSNYLDAIDNQEDLDTIVKRHVIIQTLSFLEYLWLCEDLSLQGQSLRRDLTRLLEETFDITFEEYDFLEIRKEREEERLYDIKQ